MALRVRCEPLIGNTRVLVFLAISPYREEVSSHLLSMRVSVVTVKHETFGKKRDCNNVEC